MSAASDLERTRADVQQLRETLERRERTAVDLRMVYSTLEARLERAARGADPDRRSEAVAEHLDRLLRRHESDRRPLHFLGTLVSEVNVERHARELAEELDVPGLAANVEDLATVEEGFAGTLLSFFDELADGEPDASRSDLTVAYETLLGEEDPLPMAHALVVVGLLVDLAHVAVHGAEPEVRPALDREPELAVRPVRTLRALEEVEAPRRARGTRQRLDDRLADHVDALEDADDSLVDDGVQDPLATLDWEAPIALLPVRLETRFVGDELLVRVYPDAIHVDAHEDQLTEDEYRWAREYWTKLWVAGQPDPGDLLTDDGGFDDPRLLPGPHEVDAATSLLEQIGAGQFSDGPGRRFAEVRDRLWGRGVDRFGEERAGYVIAALSPRLTDSADPRALADAAADLGEALRIGWTDDEPPLSDSQPIQFPDVDLRPEAWSRTPRASLLPDRFVALAYYEADDGDDRVTDWSDSGEGWFDRQVGTEHVRRVTGSAVREPLAVGPSPESVAAGGDATAEMAWMTDFGAAERAGVGLRVPLPEEDFDAAADGFSRLVVLGVKTSMDGDASAEALGELLSATDHTDGLELLDPGTPTNNADEPSVRSENRDPAASVDAATGPALTGPDTDGTHLARALGVDPSVFEHVPGAGDTREADARAMNRALWPGTIGYYARNLLVADAAHGESDPREDEGTQSGPLMLGAGPSRSVEGPPRLLRWLETYRDHFVEHVRAGGPFKTVRAGEQPYGMLPISPLDVDPDDRAPRGTLPGTDYDKVVETGGFTPTSVRPIPSPTFVPALVSQVWALHDNWLEWAGTLPSVTDDPGLTSEALLSMLSMEATAATYRRQIWLLGADDPLLSGLDAAARRSDVQSATRTAFEELGLGGTMPRMGNLLFLGAALTADDLPITDGDVATYVDTVHDLFASEWPDLLLRILGTDADEDEFQLSPGSSVSIDRDIIDALDPTSDPADYDPAASLLRQLLLFSAFQAGLASRVRLGALYGEHPEIPAEPTSYGPGDPSTFDLFTDSIPTGRPITGPDRLTDHPDLDAASTFRDVLHVTATAEARGHSPADPALDGFLDSLRHLATVDPARLDRLTRETMDLASHRLDAWWTSLATRRLAAIRSADVDDVQVGAYGFVENLTEGSGPDAEYLLAPSLDQATTASVLRSAHKARAGEGAQSGALAVDCSPEQVRRARPILEAVRAGLDLPELLGYRFERGLRERSAADSGLDLETYVADFRALAPAIEGKLGAGDTTDESKQSDVVDGMAIYRAWKDGTLWSDLQAERGVTFDESDEAQRDAKNAIGGDGPDDAAAEDSVLHEIDAAMEAVHDVLLAEGVHHLAHGRPERAAAALEGLSRGKTPPEPTVLDTPRSETGVTHRLLLAFGDLASGGRSDAWQATHRPLLEPSDLPGQGQDSGGATAAPTLQVRQDAEPNLNGWVGDLLPSPDRIGCTGAFRWEGTRAFAVGSFETPASSGPVSVDVGFEPDLLLFTAVAGITGDGPEATDATGWSHGVFRRAVGEYGAVRRGTGASVDASGDVGHHRSTTDSVVVEFPGADDRITGRVVSTTADGFEVVFGQVATPSGGPERVRVDYRALKLTDPTSARVGTVTTPAQPTDAVSQDLSGAGAPTSGDEFAPDHVLLSTMLPVDGDSDGDPDRLAFATGEAVLRQTDPQSVQDLTRGLSLAPMTGEFEVAARDDATLAVDTGGDSPSGLEVDLAFQTDPGDDSTTSSTVTIDVGAPDGASYAGAVPVTYVAIESPRTETPAGHAHHRPAVGYVAAPAADGTETVDVGFEPGLIEVEVIDGLTAPSGGDLPASATVDAAGTARSLGAATGVAVQRSLATGATSAGGSTASATDAVGALPASGGDGPTQGPAVSVAAVFESGFELQFSDLPGGDGPIVFYRAWPGEPATREFTRPVPGGLCLDDLELTPLDAISLTQRVEGAGDSQLERRFGYRAFRHRPTDRVPYAPPVPADATLDLAFTETTAAHDVSVAEYIEIATTIDELVREARPADASDFVHPSDGGSPGYGGSPGGASATAVALQERVQGTASRPGLADRVRDVEELLEARVTTLGTDPNPCDWAVDIDDALEAFRRSAPVRQIVDVADRVDPTDPDDRGGRTARDVARAVHTELDAVRDLVDPGPLESAGVDVALPPKPSQTVEGEADVDSATDLTVTAHAHADAVRFDPKTDDVTTDAEGAFTATFDLSGVPPGTAFTVSATPDAAGGGTAGRLLARTFDDPEPDDWKVVDEPPRTTRTSKWEFDDDAGVLRQESNIYGFAGPPIQAPGTIAVTGSLRWRDYRLSVQLSSTDDDAIGVLFRVRDADTYYRFSMDAEREYRRLVRLVDGEPELLWEAEAGYDVGERYEVTIDAVGDRLVGYLDGERLFDVRDDAIERGAVGLYCRANRGARFHGIRVDRLAGHRGEETVYAANGRVVPAADAAPGPDLPAAVSDQRYLPLLLWLDRIAPTIDPDGDSAAATLASAIEAADWEALGDEETLMGRVPTVGAGSGSPQTFGPADEAAVRDLMALRPLDLARLVRAVRATVGPASWSGLTELLSTTGDPGRPDDQRVWRSDPDGLQTVVEKHAEGEVRARLERLHEFPLTEAPAPFGAYSPPVRRLLLDGDLRREDVAAVEALLADPAAVLSTVGDVVSGLPGLLAELHDLLHHVGDLDPGRSVADVRRDVVDFGRAVDRADRTEEMAALLEGADPVWEVFEDRGDEIAAVVGDYRSGGFTSDPLAGYVTDVGEVGETTREELVGRVLPAAEHGDLSASFRIGALASVRHVLLRASYFGVYGSVPASAAGGTAEDQETLVAQAERVAGELDARLRAADENDPASDDAEPTVEGQVERIEALLGDSVVVLPPFVPQNLPALRDSLSADLVDDDYATDTWLQRIARLRDLPASFRRVRTYADALSMRTGGSPGLRRTLEAAQLPHVPGQSWLGEDDVTPDGGELALGIEFATATAGDYIEDPSGGEPSMAGLLVDEWVERVPDRAETIGLGLQYDDPSTRAPQSILLATPPAWERSGDPHEADDLYVELAGPTAWTDALLRRSIEETMDLVSMRSVDLEAMSDFGHLLPMLCFAYNRETIFDASSAFRDAPSVDFNELPWGWF